MESSKISQSSSIAIQQKIVLFHIISIITIAKLPFGLHQYLNHIELFDLFPTGGNNFEFSTLYS